MTFEKALEAMKQGKKITSKDSEFYYYMRGENEIHCINFVIGYETTVKFFCGDIFADDWEIYEEPKKKETKISGIEALYAIEVISGVLQKPLNEEALAELYVPISHALEIMDIAKNEIEIRLELDTSRKCFYLDPEMSIKAVIRLLQEIEMTAIKHKDEFEKIYTYFNVQDAIKALDFAIKTLENRSDKEEPEN